MSKHPDEEIADPDQDLQPTNFVCQSRSTIVNGNRDARHVHVLRLKSCLVSKSPENSLICSLNACQHEYLERLLKALSFILRMPVENGVLSDEKILYAVKRIVHSLSVIQSGREKSIIDIQMISKEQIEIMKEILVNSASKRLCLSTPHLNKVCQDIIFTKLPELIMKKTDCSGFDTSIRLVDAVLSEISILDTSQTAFVCPESAAIAPSGCCDSSKDFEVPFAKYRIRLCGKEISLLEAVEKLKSALKDEKSYCPKSFAADNKDLINGLLGVGLFSDSTRFLFNQVCLHIISGKSEGGSTHKNIATFGKLKRLFRWAYRRHQINPCDQLCYQELRTKISNSAKELEPGEDVDCLWNEEIALTFEALVTSQFQHICSTTDNAKFQLKWLTKFVSLLATKRQLWPKGTMNAEFLKAKASEFLEILQNSQDSNLTHLPSVPVSCDIQTRLTEQQRKKMKHYHDLDKPGSSKDAGDNLCFDSLLKKASQKVRTGSHHEDSLQNSGNVPLDQIMVANSDQNSNFNHLGSESSRPSFTMASSEMSCLRTSNVVERRKSSRHRSDESLGENRYLSSNSPRRKRYTSNESFHEPERIAKKPKLKERYAVKEMTDYDKKLQSYHVWDPLVNVTEAKFKDVFKTKEGIPETFREQGTAGASMSSGNLDSTNKTVGKCDEEILADKISPGKKDDNSESGLVLEEKSSGGIERQNSSTDKKSRFLEEIYGDMTVETNNSDTEKTSVIISIQGYVFEGIAATQEDAVELASSKALLLAPFILQRKS